MANKNIHTTYNHQAGNWRNISEGASKPAKTFATKQQAQSAGREAAIRRQVEQYVHNKDGKIGERNSYGHDPKNVKG